MFLKRRMKQNTLLIIVNKIEVFSITTSRSNWNIKQITYYLSPEQTVFFPADLCIREIGKNAFFSRTKTSTYTQVYIYVCI